MSKLKDFLLQNTSTGQTILKNAFWLTVGRVGSRLFRALIIIYAARVLGAAGYGVFAYVIGLAGFFTTFSDIGLTHILTRGVSQKPKEASHYFATVFWIKVLLLILITGLIIFVAPTFSRIEGVKVLVPFIALLVVFDSLRELATGFFRGKEKMELEALLIIVTNVAITLFSFAVLYVTATTQALTFTYILSAGTGTVLGIVILRQRFAQVFSSFRVRLLRPILSSAWPVALLGVLGVFMLNTDILMLGFFRTAEEVGFYSAGQKIVQFLYILPTILATSTFPVFSRLVVQKHKKKVSVLMKKTMVAVLLIAVPLIVGSVVLGKGIIHFLYGEAYLPAVLAFQILIFSIIFVFPGNTIGNYILAHNKQRKMAPYIVLGVASNVMLNAILIPLYGIVGAAIATLSAHLLYNCSIWQLAKRVNNFSTFRHLQKIVVATVAMGIAVLIFKTLGLHLIVNILFSTLVYFGVLIALKEEMLKELKHVVP